MCRDARARARRGWRASIDATTTTRSVMDDARASSTRSGDDAIASPRVERALKALRFELASGCVDVRGKTSTFSEFARNELVTMGEEIGAVDDARRAKWDEECASAFAKYEGLNARQRERALHAARDLLNGTTETPTKTRRRRRRRSRRASRASSRATLGNTRWNKVTFVNERLKP